MLEYIVFTKFNAKCFWNCVIVELNVTYLLSFLLRKKRTDKAKASFVESVIGSNLSV